MRVAQNASPELRGKLEKIIAKQAAKPKPKPKPDAPEVAPEGELVGKPTAPEPAAAEPAAKGGDKESGGGGSGEAVNSDDPNVKGKVRKGQPIPKGFIILRTQDDWHYYGTSRAESLDLFRTGRFRMINEFRTLSV